METVYLALGSNVGDSQQFIADAIKLLEQRVSNIELAPVYRSKAVGFTEQPDFFNTVIRGQTELEPHELITFIKTVEQHVGRVARFRWGPREIDIDIIFYGEKVIDDDDLAIPHPRFAERDFVLRPLADLAPNAIDPTTKLTVTQLLKQLPASAQSTYGKA